MIREVWRDQMRVWRGQAPSRFIGLRAMRYCRMPSERQFAQFTGSGLDANAKLLWASVLLFLPDLLVRVVYGLR